MADDDSPEQEATPETPAPAVPAEAAPDGGEVAADTQKGYRVLETHHAPTYYFPRSDVLARLDKELPSVTLTPQSGN